MQGVNHKRIGAGVAIVAGHASGLPIVPALAVGVISYAASPLPDIDQKLPLIKHRTITHWISTCLLFAAFWALMTDWFLVTNIDAVPYIGVYLAEWLPMIIGLGLAIGCVAHTLADSLTIMGSPLAGPLSRKNFHLLPAGLRVRVGNMYKDSASESAMMVFLFLAISV
jgi:membrane-bound metal-dependent hydrolase YbcI (DUF457 family)